MDNHDIHIALAAPDIRKDTFYEIIIGGWKNTKSVLRKKKQGPAVVTSKIVNKYNVWQKIRILKNKNQLSVTVNDIQVISYYDPSPINGQYIGFSSWDNQVYYSNIRVAVPSGGHSSTSSSKSGQATYAYYPASQLTVGASSELKSSNTSSGRCYYKPKYTLDNNLQTAWSEGVSGYGIGQYIEYTFPETVKLAALKIANGYQKSIDLYQSNGRIKKARLDFDNNQSHLVSLNDAVGWQRLDLPKIYNTRKVRLTITEAYPGGKYQDVLNSEIKFLHQKI